MHGALRLSVNAYQLSHIHQTQTGDVELICTGKSMKWISISQTEQAQHFVFVDAPEEFKTVDTQQMCPSMILADHKYDFAVHSHLVLAHYQAYQDKVSELLQRPYTSFTYLTSDSRAPPYIS